MWPSARISRPLCTLYLVLLTTGPLLGARLAVGQAQITTTITPDGTLGTMVTQSSGDYAIRGGTLRGGNLFHSFDQFSVGTGASASFHGASGIENIISRVTGGQLSSIDGSLRSEIAGANFFLLNPNGVLFGPHVSLNVSGSFHVSTADELRFADGATFSAHIGRESMLTVASPAAFGFLGSQPAPVTIQGGWLQVPKGQTLSVVGGDIQLMGGTLRAPSGRLQLASVGSPGEVRFSPLELAPDLQVDGFVRLGRLELSRNARVDASGDGGGTVLIRGGRVVVDSSRILANTLGDVDGNRLGIDLVGTEETVIKGPSLIQTGTQGAGRAGEIRLTGGRVLIDGSGIGETEVRSGGPNKEETFRGTTGAAGDIIIRVRELTLTNGGLLSSASFNAGGSGDLSIVATEGVFIGRSAGVFSAANASGAGGDIFVSARSLTLQGVSSQLVSRTGSNPGDAGNIVLKVGRLTLTGGALIASGTEGSGRSGALTIQATEGVFIVGRDREGNPSRISSTTTLGGTTEGAVGSILIDTPTLYVEGGLIDAKTSGSGDAGSIVLEVGRLTLTGGLISSSTEGTGRGGDIQIVARDIQLGAGGTIAASSSGMGAAGTIRIQASETFQSHHGHVTTASARGGGGQIELGAGTLLALSESELTTAVRGGEENAGNLTIKAGLIAVGNSTVSANAFGGRGGNIRIEAETLLRDPATQVSASSDRNLPGTVEIQAPATNLNVVVTPLALEFVPDTALLHDRCAARLREGAVSSLVARGRDGVPPSPEGVLPGRLDPGYAKMAHLARETGGARRPEGRPDRRVRLQGRHHPAPKDFAPTVESPCPPQ